MLELKVALLAAVFHVAFTWNGGDWLHRRELNSGYVLQWTYDENSITMKVTARTIGWVGIGVRYTHSMIDADLIIGGVRNNTPYAEDYHALQNGFPVLDSVQDVEILNATENRTHTVMVVKRPLSSGDIFDKEIMIGKSVIVLWAFGQSDKAPGQTFRDYNGSDRGSAAIMLVEEESSTLDTASVIDSKKSATELNEPIDFAYSAALNATESVNLYWNFNDTTITLQMIAPTTGWIGVGFARTASMYGADLIMMGVEFNKIYAVDCHAEQNGVPEIDKDQNVEIISGWENGSHTGITIRRSRLTCNSEDMDIQSGTFKVIWAYGEEDLGQNNPSWRYYHQRNRGGVSLKLINPVASRASLKSKELYQADVGPRDFVVPAKSTYYLCQFVKLIEAKETVYVTKFIPYFTKGNEKNVHHMIIFLCNSDVSHDLLKKNYSCYDGINPFAVGCSKILGGWAVGATGTQFPENTAFAVGGYDHPQYLLIEVHYDNPDEKEFRDSSGLRMFYVKEKPDQLVGMFDVSQSLTSIWIPPDSERFRIKGYCRERCVTAALKNSGLSEVKIFGVFLHSHLAGRSLRLRHYRNGKEIQALIQDEFYDFDYQETQYFEEPKILKAGDALTFECDYRTTERSNVTTGGLPTTSEMCIAYVFHYPPLDMTLCGSRIKFIEDSSGMHKLATGLNISLDGLDLNMINSKMTVNYWSSMAIFSDEILAKVEWNNQTRQFAQEFTNNATQYTSCLNRIDQLVNYFDEFVPTPEDDYVGTNPMCPK